MVYCIIQPVWDEKQKDPDSDEARKPECDKCDLDKDGCDAQCQD